MAGFPVSLDLVLATIFFIRLEDSTRFLFFRAQSQRRNTSPVSTRPSPIRQDVDQAPVLQLFPPQHRGLLQFTSLSKASALSRSLLCFA
jgi:hypothetical protein